MDIKEFFDLPNDQKELLVSMYQKQRMIRNTRIAIEAELKRLETRRINNQMECDHPFATKKYQAHENEFGNLTGGGYYRYHCEDCDARWQEDK